MASYVFNPAPYNPLDNNNPQQTYLEGINDLGQIVGSYTFTSDPLSSETDAFEYNPEGGGYVELNILASTGSYAAGINQQGEIVGSFENNGNGDWQGVLDNDGAITTLDFPHATATRLSGINDSDQIVGNYTDQDGNSHGVVYSAGAWSVSVIAGPAGYNVSFLQVNGINDSGQVVGYFADGIPWLY